MLQIYFLQNRNMLHVSQTHELQKRQDPESWKLKGGASGLYIICRCNFKVNKFGNLSLLGKSVLFLREPFQSVGKKGFLRSNSC